MMNLHKTKRTIKNMAVYKEIVVLLSSKPYYHFIISFILFICPLLFIIIPIGHNMMSDLVTSITSITRVLAFILILTGTIMIYRKNLVKVYKDAYKNHKEDYENLQSASWVECKEIISYYFKNNLFNLQTTKEKYLFTSQCDNFSVIIDCRNWEKKRISHKEIVSVFNERAIDRQYHLLYIISKGEFSKESYSFAFDKKLKLISGYQLVEWEKIKIKREKNERRYCKE